jgi:hypothetical protein
MSAMVIPVRVWTATAWEWISQITTGRENRSWSNLTETAGQPQRPQRHQNSACAANVTAGIQTLSDICATPSPLLFPQTTEEPLGVLHDVETELYPVRFK